MDPKQINQLIQKLKEDTISESEKRVLLDWYRDLASRKSEFPEEEESVRLRMLLRLKKETNPARPARLIYLRIGAAAAVLAIIFSVYVEWPALQRSLHPVRLTVLRVPTHQKQRIALADGTVIWVNSGSELKYPQTFTGGTREVYLSGEAYFDVRHNAAQPFIIHTGKVITTVLGTAFDIREDKISHLVIVTVTRGKVSVANGDRPLAVLTPNQQVSFNTKNQIAVQNYVNAEQAIAWQKVDLHFEDITFSEAAKQLEQRFNVKISFTNNRIKNCRFTGASLTGDKIDKVLKAICDFNNATYTVRQDGSILIDGPGCD